MFDPHHGLFRLGHHHFTELIKVHGSGSVLIELLKDSLKLLLSKGGEQLTDQAPEGLSGDVAQTLLVVYPVTMTFRLQT